MQEQFFLLYRVSFKSVPNNVNGAYIAFFHCESLPRTGLLWPNQCRSPVQCSSSSIMALKWSLRAWSSYLRKGSNRGRYGFIFSWSKILMTLLCDIPKMLETRRVNCFGLTVNDAATSNFISSVVTDNGRPVLFASYASQMANDINIAVKKYPLIILRGKMRWMLFADGGCFWKISTQRSRTRLALPTL